MFDEFWKAYPRKVGKPTALTAFHRKVKKMTTPQFTAMGEGCVTWVRFWDESGTETQFIPHPSRFINDERYNDTPPEIVQPPDASSMGALHRLAERGDR